MNLGDNNVLIVVEMIAQAGGFAAVWYKARQAEKLSRPTGNGFAQDVKNALRRIETKVDSHLRDHARGEIERRTHDR